MNFRSLIEPLYERFLRFQCRHVPNHVAIIQDGNRRYAKMVGIDTASGHRAGADKTEEILDWAHELGIRHITLYTFSTENFSRDKNEVRHLFDLFKEKLNQVVQDERLKKYRIRIQMVGDRSLLPDDLRKAVDDAENLTRDHDGFFLNIALAYGGRNEIVLAAREILTEVAAGRLAPDAIGVHTVEQHLHGGKGIPPVDLIIRTGNDYRTSNFLPWLAGGHESAVCFCAPYWPMFRKIDFLRAMRIHDQRVAAKNAGNHGG
ncbi:MULTISPECIES: polyprenyl diphosphate synthase [unclassified Methanoregula]|uniref:polyprenyl diphosphate synthase n=1 Tax=unclassified Methanoregula TaxID=2649730 RepID=UPI0009D185C3|nr:MULTISPECIES: polyprenyl diphosphate synthase [unclassified Methanoregula]OPX64947.1 MAG: Tritrans,polycis-undecaprenyl-diphosphate synthase (GGDP specific) [Methanoregula sp. PtaB.Bin085]OPY32999.1 MAG: Tritrans,polycis-undecaprenyl-diphosphate synthase (GGDP specific) [Methanoregula sp. PtaU1.Bin006]